MWRLRMRLRLLDYLLDHATDVTAPHSRVVELELIMSEENVVAAAEGAGEGVDVKADSELKPEAEEGDVKSGVLLEVDTADSYVNGT